MSIPQNPVFEHGSNAFIGIGSVATPLVPRNLTKYFTDPSQTDTADSVEVTTLQPAGSRKSFIYGLASGNMDLPGKIDAPAGEIYRDLGAIVASKKPVRIVHCPFGEAEGSLRIYTMVLITNRGCKSGISSDVSMPITLQLSGEIFEDVVPAGEDGWADFS